MFRNSVLLKKRVIPQPLQALNTAGDCGACVLGSLFNLSIKEVYERFNNGEPKGFTIVDLRNILLDTNNRKYFERAVTDVPYWQVKNTDQAFGNPSWNQSQEWFNYIRMGLDGGYYPIPLVHYKKGGCFSIVDHVVMICGCREKMEPLPRLNTHIIKPQILVSCPATTSLDEEWVDVKDFLKERGGFNCLLVRPLQDKQP